jgi:DNA-binding CsgD family transcriptional regulator
MILLFGTGLFSEFIAPSTSLVLLFHALLAAGAIIGCITNVIFTRFFYKIRLILPLLSLIFATAVFWANLFMTGKLIVPMMAAAWFATGFGLAFMVVQWSEFVSLLRLGRSKMFFSLSAFIGTLWVLVMLTLNPAYQPFLVYSIPLISLTFLIFLRRYYRPYHDISYIGRAESFGRMRLSWKPVLSTVVSSAATGFGLSWLYTFHAIDTPAYELILAIMVAGTLLFVMIDAFRWKRLGEDFLIKTFLVFVVVGLLPLLFLGHIGALFVGVLLSGMMITIVFGNSAISEHVKLFNLAPMQTIAFGRLFSFLGILLGFGFGYLAFWSNLFGELSFTVVLVFLLILFVAQTVFIMMENHYPLSEEGDIEGDIVHVALLAGAAGAIEGADNDPDLSRQKEKGTWKRKCMAAAEAYGLSNRQREVLFYLAKGRNAEWITEELVISRHTAKAHIYNIYQNLGVNSRQELIDLVEAVQLN